MPKGKSKRNNGKRKWRRNKHMNRVNYDEKMAEIVTQIKKDGMVHEPTNQITSDVTKMFKIDTVPAHEKDGKLNPQRFTKTNVRPMATIDKLKVDKMLRYGIPQQPKADSNELFNLWGDEVKKPLNPKPVIEDTKKTYHIPALLKPHSGQSINPSLKA